jgi:iron complex outermembrane recepter protein
MKTNHRFNQKLLPSLIAAVAMAGFQVQAHAEDATEEVVVTGVRAAQERAIDIKKNSAEVVDSISAEDIGKLPDATIADSLQRVTGIQIQRSAGQGGIVSIRGSREVLTTLNGEYFLTAESMLDSRADFKDIPASLISGMNVSKSANAKTLEGGIGGIIDLLTKRSLELEEGLTFSARAQAGYGDIVQKVDPEISGLIGFNMNDTFAQSVSFSYSETNSSDNFVKTKFGNDRAAETWDCGAAGCADLDGNGSKTGDFLIPRDWNGPEISNTKQERERLGLTYNLNAELDEAFEINADVFYTKAEEKGGGNYIQLGEGGDRKNLHDYVNTTGKPALRNIRSLQGLKTKTASQFYALEWSNLLDGGFRAGNEAKFRDTDALNTSIEVKYDEGGKLTGSVRWVTAKGKRENNDLTLVQRANSPGGTTGIPVSPGGPNVVLNPGQITQRYATTFGLTDDSSYLTFDPAFVTELNKTASWYFHSGWVESGKNKTENEVLRADGNYKFGDEGITSVDFGIRSSTRNVTKDVYSWFSPTKNIIKDRSSAEWRTLLNLWTTTDWTKEPFFQDGNRDGQVDLKDGKPIDGRPEFTDKFKAAFAAVPNLSSGALVKYHEAGYALGQRDARFSTGWNITADATPAIRLNDPKLSGYLTTLTDLGAAVTGYNAAIPVIDPDKINDAVEFQAFLYGPSERRLKPDQSYVVDESRDSTYFTFNFEQPLTDALTLNGNFGVRKITDTITVARYRLTGGTANDILAGNDANHTVYNYAGQDFTTVNHNYTLPSLNVNLLLNDEFKFKFAYDERISLQPLDNFGKGEYSGYQSQVVGEGFQRINEVNKGGNPYLKPWEATVYNLAAEWYPTDNSLLGASFFYMDIGGFTRDAQTFDPSLPDSDGVARRGAQIKSLENGSNASVKGLELSYQQSFDFLPSFLANTGATFNYTYSPSENQAGYSFLSDGGTAPFNNTAKNQSNMVLWYQDDLLEGRIAFNYLGKQYDGDDKNWPWGDDYKNSKTIGMDKWKKSSLFIDFSSTVHVAENVDVNFSVNNITGEGDIKYFHYEDLINEIYAFETRYNLGVNVKF